MVRILGTPLQEEKGRVVAGGAAPFTHQGVGKPADGHLHGVVLSFGTLQLGDESLDAELLPTTLRVFFDDAVGEEQHPVAGLQRLLADVRGVSSDADGQCGCAAQCTDDYARRAARSRLLFFFGALPIGAIGPKEVQQWTLTLTETG